MQKIYLGKCWDFLKHPLRRRPLLPIQWENAPGKNLGFCISTKFCIIFKNVVHSVLPQAGPTEFTSALSCKLQPFTQKSKFLQAIFSFLFKSLQI